jgi:hypothetical protein
MLRAILQRSTDRTRQDFSREGIKALYLSVLVARCAVLPKLWLFNSLESVGSIIYVSRSVCQPVVIQGCGKAYVVGDGQVLLWDSVLAGELANAACVIR